MRAVLYTILGLLAGVVGGGVFLGMFFLGLSRTNTLIIWAVITLGCGIGGFLLARKIDAFDKSPIESLRLNYLITGLLGLILLPMAALGMIQMADNPLAIAGSIAYVGLLTAIYIFYGFNLHLHLTPERLIFVKAFLGLQLLSLTAVTLISGNSIDWVGVLVQAGILYNFYAKLQEASVEATEVISV